MFNRHGLWLDAISERRGPNMRFREWLRHHVWVPFVEAMRYEHSPDDPVVGYANGAARDWLDPDVKYRCLQHYYTAGDLASGWHPVHKSDAELVGLVCEGCTPEQ